MIFFVFVIQKICFSIIVNFVEDSLDKAENISEDFKNWRTKKEIKSERKKDRETLRTREIENKRDWERERERLRKRKRGRKKEEKKRGRTKEKRKEPFVLNSILFKRDKGRLDSKIIQCSLLRNLMWDQKK